MKFTERRSLRIGLLLLNGLAVAFGSLIVLGELAWRMFGPYAYGPILLGLLAPLLALAFLTFARTNQVVLVAMLVANTLLLMVAFPFVGLSSYRAGWFWAFLVLLVVVVPLANVLVGWSRWASGRAARVAL